MRTCEWMSEYIAQKIEWYHLRIIVLRYFLEFFVLLCIWWLLLGQILIVFMYLEHYNMTFNISSALENKITIHENCDNENDIPRKSSILPVCLCIRLFKDGIYGEWDNSTALHSVYANNATKRKEKKRGKKLMAMKIMIFKISDFCNTKKICRTVSSNRKTCHSALRALLRRHQIIKVCLGTFVSANISCDSGNISI